MKKTVFLLALLLNICFSASALTDNAIVEKTIKSLKMDTHYNSLTCSSGFGYNIMTFYYDDYISTVYCDSLGVVNNYIKKQGETNKTGLPLLTKSEAKGIATSFVLSAASDIIGTLDTVKAEVTYNGSFQVVFYRKVNGILFDKNYVMVGVDSDTGEIMSYSRYYDYDISFLQFDSVIENKDINNIFKQNNALGLCYSKKLVNKTAAAYPVYTANPLEYYNAVDGNVIYGAKNISYDNYFDVTTMYEKTNDTSYEQTDVLGVAEALKIVSSMEELGIDEKYEISKAKYLKNSNNNSLIVLEYNGQNCVASVTLNAQNKKVCEFNTTKTYSADKAMDKDEKMSVVSHYISAYLSEYKDDMNLSEIVYGDKTVFLYERIVNGIPFKSNGLCIVLDLSGNITNISFLWDEIEFPDTADIISADKAYEIFNEKCGFELRYYNDNGIFIPVYSLSSQTSGIIDAFTGDVLSYDGKVMQPKKYLAYVDINTHYSKPQVEKMADCDIFVSRGNVALGEPIIQKDFLLLISSYLPDGKPIIENFGDITQGQLEMLYNAFEAAGVLTSDEIDIDGYITREQAVKYFIKTIRYSDVAQAYEIFSDHFKDEKSISKELIGYVELARGLGIVCGHDGYFKPKEYVSNGDSLIMVYNYLSKVRG